MLSEPKKSPLVIGVKEVIVTTRLGVKKLQSPPIFQNYYKGKKKRQKKLHKFEVEVAKSLNHKTLAESLLLGEE